ncbi:glutamate synthase large subunit [Pontibacter sp. G13]|uniref:glutamate synthase large subunit n=1 Tax=Pontibacter sp. G13 TaxID=3074898 RepID=UPI00288C2C2D|nr:glutamate synthase large subunit [Pontibacter sp. G13]WNJ20946.1 glutamate synthase large subunit [Pontibacter sp. G13]
MNACGPNSTNSVPSGLYVPELEHDACGIGFIADLKGTPTHSTITDALNMLTRMEHRGACGADPQTGDGAGILIKIPHDFFQEEAQSLGFELPAPGKYGVGMVFFPSDEARKEPAREILEAHITKLGFKLLGFRPVETDSQKAHIGTGALATEPSVEQVFVAPIDPWTEETLERKLFLLRRATSHAINQAVTDMGDDFYFTSVSSRTIVYKGQFRTDQVGPYFPDLTDPRVKSPLALVHSRFSTNTFPKWRLAQPFRFIAHNGEINTIKGNVAWMRAKEVMMDSPHFTREELDMMLPTCDPKHSDSRNLDSIVELLVMSGRSLPHAMMMLIPEAWQKQPDMDPAVRAFYEYHSVLMEPWDGPASVCFTDGKMVGATLDRNGLRPSRYLITKDHRLILASEAGALPVDPKIVVKRGRLQPGRMLIADLEAGELINDHDMKARLSARRPYQKWLDENKLDLQELPDQQEKPKYEPNPTPIKQRQALFGMTQEELQVILMPMAQKGKEPIGSMGADTPLAVLSNHSQHISHYFKQLFAQVSNPPIDPIRESSVMSLSAWIGGAKNVLAETPAQCKHIAIHGPILTNAELHKIRHIEHAEYKPATLDAVFSTDESLEDALSRLEQAATKALDDGATILIVSDRAAGEGLAPIPGLMASATVHHHLIRSKRRHETALIVETGDAREVHHFATLIGYGAIAVNPYLAFDSLQSVAGVHPMVADYTVSQLHRQYIQSVELGLLKVFSKMGISTLQSYHGSQIFEVLGINQAVVKRCFTGSISRIGGLDFQGIAQEVLVRYQQAFPEDVENLRLPFGGLYSWRQDGEKHLFDPKTIHLLQKSTKTNDYGLYKQYSEAIQDPSRPVTLRSLFEFTGQSPIALEEVEPAESLFKRFATGAMSFGSLSHEAHSTLAIAMNRIGGKSNSGEGGEDPSRFDRKSNGDWERSATKQIASGRFGVTSWYLSEAEELQIKMAQGAKPGEGGQLPGHKVDPWIGRVRHSTPGVGLISPPPHHDIYSIEDLAQLIYDLKNANRSARISVKLVSEAGVGTIAAGVAKAHADHILISGSDGGTGASPLSSIRHAGLPWELGLAEAHQTLVKNKLRNRVTLQADGQIKTGRDLAIATLLGAEEWGVATAALVVEGCIMMRKCHLNTCPVGVATQNPELRKLFTGKPEDLVNFFTFLAEEMREIMAELGFRTVNEMVGQVQKLKVREDLAHWKFSQLDWSPILHAEPNHGMEEFKAVPQDHGIDSVMDWELLEHAKPALDHGLPVFKTFPIENIDRSVGTLLSNELTKRHKDKGISDGSIHFKFLGSAGQSFAAFAAKGIRFELEGEANDYVGKGLSGSQLVIYPSKEAPFEPRKNIIIGNVALYGATSGEAFIRGIAGERFAVRNSGATAVVEGVGDHGCEYMTGGTVVIMGPTGKNFAAGMSGGVAFVYNQDQSFQDKCNQEQVDLDPLTFSDTELLKELISRHYNFTGSRTALRLVTDWEQEVQHFVKVMPKEYKAILEKQAEQAWLSEERKIG